jgi:hypothetical protein
MAVPVFDDKVRTSENTDQARETHEKPRFLPHFPNSSVGRRLTRLNSTTRKQPEPTFTMSGDKHPLIPVAQGDRDGRDLQQLLAAHDVTKMANVLSHAQVTCLGRLGACLPA